MHGGKVGGPGFSSLCRGGVSALPPRIASYHILATVMDSLQVCKWIWGLVYLDGPARACDEPLISRIHQNVGPSIRWEFILVVADRIFEGGKSEFT